MTSKPIEIHGNARGEVRRYCWVTHVEVPRLDTLSHRLRSLNGESAGRIQRPDLLSALFVSGLDLAESTAQKLVVYRPPGVRYEYYMKLDDVERVKRLASRLWPSVARRPGLPYVHGALIRLTLHVAEKDESRRSELASRLLRAPELA